MIKNLSNDALKTKILQSVQSGKETGVMTTGAVHTFLFIAYPVPGLDIYDQAAQRFGERIAKLESEPIGYMFRVEQQGDGSYKMLMYLCLPETVTAQ